MEGGPDPFLMDVSLQLGAWVQNWLADHYLPREHYAAAWTMVCALTTAIVALALPSRPLRGWWHRW